MIDKALTLQYDKKKQTFDYYQKIENFTEVDSQQKSIVNLINYFSDDRVYKELASSTLIRLLLGVIFLCTMIIIVSGTQADFRISNFKNIQTIPSPDGNDPNLYAFNQNSKGLSTTNEDENQSQNVVVIFGFFVLLDFIFIVLMILNEYNRRNLYINLQAAEIKSLQNFEKSNQYQLKVKSGHKKQRVFCLPFFSCYDFYFHIFSNSYSDDEKSFFNKKSQIVDGETTPDQSMSKLNYSVPYNQIYQLQIQLNNQSSSL